MEEASSSEEEEEEEDEDEKDKRRAAIKLRMAARARVDEEEEMKEEEEEEAGSDEEAGPDTASPFRCNWQPSQLCFSLCVYSKVYQADGSTESPKPQNNITAVLSSNVQVDTSKTRQNAANVYRHCGTI
jgi:hypothetical protein